MVAVDPDFSPPVVDANEFIEDLVALGAQKLFEVLKPLLDPGSSFGLYVSLLPRLLGQLQRLDLVVSLFRHGFLAC